MKGISIPIRISCVCLITGAWIRLFSDSSFYFILTGQCIMACGNAFVQSIGPKVAGVWFGDNERAFITTLISISHVIGVMFGFVFPIFFVSDSDKHNPKVAKDKVWNYILIQSITITVMAIPIFILIWNQPANPPSKSAKIARKRKPISVIQSIKKLIAGPNVWLLMISYAFIFSIYVVLGASVGLLSDKYGYSSNDNSLFGVVVVVSGLIGSFIHAILLDKYKKFKIQYVLVSFMTILSIIFLILVIDLHNIVLTCISLGCLGSSVVPIIGVGYSFCAEITFPVGESTSCGTMQIVSSIASTLITLLFNMILQKFGGAPALLTLGASAIIGCLISVFIVEKLNKTNVKFMRSGYSFSMGVVPVCNDEEENEELDKPSHIDSKNLLENSKREIL